jgi:secondary thiamine-phosphate synthase enzyme
MADFFTVKTSSPEELIDITAQVRDVVEKSNISDGICVVYTPHTTAAITINENADPDVRKDLLKGLRSIGIEGAGYSHSEGNSPSHIKSSLIGCSETVIIENGKLLLGTWQGIYFCEFDGPRSRKVFVRLM